MSIWKRLFGKADEIRPEDVPTIRIQMEKKNGSLLRATALGDLEEVTRLIAEGADVTCIDPMDGVATPIVQAASNGHIDVVKILLAKGADPNGRNIGGNTALMLASRFGHTDVVKVLLAGGADLNARDRDGATAFENADEHPETQAVLRAAGVCAKHEGDTPTKAAPAPAPGGTLALPTEFDGKLSYREMFRTRTPERLRDLCHALPVEALDLKRPDVSREMGRAITQVFAVSNYMATREVPTEFGDIVFPRLVARISEYDGSDLHLELCDLVRDFAIHLAAAKRYPEAASVMRVLKRSLFWRAWSEGDLCLFASLHNIALKSDLPLDVMDALEAAKHIPAAQVPQVADAIKNLEQKFEALL